MFLLLLIAKSPNGKQFSFLFLSFFSLLPIVFIVIIFLIFLVLAYHSFHYFHTSFEWSWISSSWIGLFILLLLVSTLLIVFVFFFKLLNIRIPYLPLSNLTPKIIGNWRASRSSSFFNGGIYGLNLSAFIIELVSHSLLDRFHIFSRSGLFLFSLPLNLLKFGFANVLNFLLHLVFVRWGTYIISLKTQMHD